MPQPGIRTSGFADLRQILLARVRNRGRGSRDAAPRRDDHLIVWQSYVDATCVWGRSPRGYRTEHEALKYTRALRARPTRDASPSSRHCVTRREGIMVVIARLPRRWSRLTVSARFFIASEVGEIGPKLSAFGAGSHRPDTRAEQRSGCRTRFGPTAPTDRSQSDGSGRNNDAPDDPTFSPFANRSPVPRKGNAHSQSNWERALTGDTTMHGSTKHRSAYCRRNIS